MPESSGGLDIQIADEELRGRYSNLLRVAHTREEIILDFIVAVPPTAVVTSRVVTSPGHLKRIVRALQENLRRYEESYGEIPESPPPVDEEPVH